MKRNIIIAALAAAATLSISAGSAQASGCGYYALGGAFHNLNSAYNRAGNIDASVYDLDRSNSPNAGKGYYAVALGPVSRWRAKDYRRQFKRNGVRGAYVKRMCFYGGRL